MDADLILVMKHGRVIQQGTLAPLPRGVWPVERFTTEGPEG